MHRFRATLLIVVTLFATLPLLAQTQTREMDTLVQAQQALSAAEQAGARTYAITLYDEASWRIRFAQENWSHAKSATREQARLRALEALWAARAALAKANWLSTNAAIRSLQGDISRFGGRMEVTLPDEPAAIPLTRGNTSMERIDFAQRVVDQAKAGGAAQIAADDVKTAQEYLDTARRIARANTNSDTADYLAYVAEMMARRAFYLARMNESSRHLGPLQLERTRLAQSESERQAAAERAQREEAQRQAEELQRQLRAEQQNRQAQAAELERLRSQVEENQRLILQRLEQDRAARVEAERRLDEAFARYESAIATGSPTDVETLRRQVEDLQIALRAVQERERLNEATLIADIDRLRAEIEVAQRQGSPHLSALQAELIRRQTQLDNLRRERADDVTRRMELERQHQATIADAQRRRQEAEAQAEALRKQVADAQAAAQQAALAAQQAQQQAQQTQAELDKTRQDAAQREEQRQAELQRVQQQAQQTQAELDKTRQELAQREAEARRERMQQELARIARTRSDQRGFIVTLPGIFFDTGKSVLKPGARRTLSRIADQLKTDATVKIAIEGHTDSVGSEEKNHELSHKRAEAVRDFLVSAGLSADRITASGKGEAEPIATNKTAAGRQQNRRVDLVIQ